MDDEVLSALDELTAALHENNASNTRSIEQAEVVRRMRAEGMTMDAIATLFGVTRQRISELLRD